MREVDEVRRHTSTHADGLAVRRQGCGTKGQGHEGPGSQGGNAHEGQPPTGQRDAQIARNRDARLPTVETEKIRQAGDRPVKPGAMR